MVDKCNLTIESGKGGDGIIAFDNHRKADGGDGGDGGDIYVVGDSNVYDLSKLCELKKVKAQNGESGNKNKKTGKKGEDLEIHLPLITKIFDEYDNEILTVSMSNFRVKLLEGGKGGEGNFTLRGNGWDGKMSRKKGEPGLIKNIKLELNLKADAIFLGLPNAGKSSIVNSLSNAKYKVAPYKFTTLNPQLAVMDRYVLMDLPGLIEGTFKGKGLGKDFVKHTKYAKLLVHCISLENENILDVYKMMRKEFLKISEGLYSIPEFIVFTKADIYSPEQLELKKKELKRYFKDAVYISVYRKEDIKLLKEELKKRLGSISNSII